VGFDRAHLSVAKCNSEIDVTADSARRSEMIQASGRRTVPQIFIGEQSIGGFDELYALEQSGELDGLLRAAS